MSHFLDSLLSNPFDAAHLSAYIWLLFIVAQLTLSFTIEPKDILERLSILFQKQHLLLLFSAIIVTGYLFSPVIRVDGGMVHNMVKAKDLAMNVNFPIIGHYFVSVCEVAALITLSLNLLTTFFYKYRGLQIVLCWLSIIPALYSFCYTYYRMTTTEMIQDQLFYYGNISPIVAVLFIFLAMFYIRKDDDLVKSVDRLR